MNKSAIQKFAIWARTTLMEQVAQRAYQYGITKDGYGEENAVTVNGMALSPQEQSQRRELVREIQTKGYDQVVEEVAYTWFNRFIALRYMEVNNYLPSHIRVFSNAQGAFDPEILKEALHIDLPGLDQSKVAEYIEKNETEALYRYLLLTQCNALNEGLPKMFEKMGGYTELLFPNNILRPDSVLGRMVADIPEEDWTDQVQIIGWLYQYYNTELKAETFDLLKKNVKVTKERIPSATQLFTPDWIVRYMVENSLGRLWLEGHPNQALRESWKYYLDEAEQEPEVEAKLVVLRSQRQTLRPEDITLIDPCMGSGHILVYAFDVLMQIYESEGWSQRDAAAAIVQKNLYGLDIDRRAAQLAYFAVMMKARQYDRRFLIRGIQPNLYHPGAYADGQDFGSLLIVDKLEPKPEQPDEITLFDGDYTDKLNTWNFRSLLARQYDVVVTNPPYMGSSNMNDKLSKFVKDNHPDAKGDLFSCFIERGNRMAQADGYNCMVTMQSWMFLSSFEKLRQKLLHSKTIINLMHMENMVMGIAFGTAVTVFRNCRIDGFKGIYNQIKLQDIEDDTPKEFPVRGNRFAQIGASNFSKIPGSPIAYWVSKGLQKAFEKYETIGKIAPPKQGLATADNDRFLRRWHEPKFTKIGFGIPNSVAAEASGFKWFPYNKGGAFRRWYGNCEYVVNWEHDGYEIRNFKDTTGKVRSRPQNTAFYFKSAITWSDITSASFSGRYSPPGFIFDVKGSSGFPNQNILLYVLSFLNSAISQSCIKILNPTVTTQVGDMSRIPLIIDHGKKETIDYLGEQCVNISKTDWDSYETSWDFKRHPLLNYGVSIYSGLGDGSNPPTAQFGIEKSEISFKIFEKNRPQAYTIRSAFDMWNAVCEQRFQQLKANEEELNRIFIEIYGLQDELTPEVADKDVTVHRIFNTRDDVPESMKSSNYVRTLRDEIVSLISYAVGCLFGRYSPLKDGLLFAGGKWDYTEIQQELFDAIGKNDFTGRDFVWDANLIDKDNILPICDDDYFEDDLTGKFVDFVRVVYGEDTLEENLKFIADALGGKGAPREVIRSYFINDFFADHCKTYQKRPIYWLFDSGKKNGFKALIYLHRYQRDLLARMRTDYVHEQQERYRTQLSHLADSLEHASGADKVRLTKQQKKLQDQSRELQTYEEKIHHLADQNIELDLDDGVKVNYAKFGDVLAKIK